MGEELNTNAVYLSIYHYMKSVKIANTLYNNGYHSEERKEDRGQMKTYMCIQQKKQTKKHSIGGVVVSFWVTPS